MRGITDVVPLADTVGVYEKFEAVIDLDADFTNPYDPDDIQLDARFTSPAGESVLVPGFFMRGYELDLNGTRDRVTPTGEAAWRVRFTPNEEGDWSYQVIATTANGSESSPTQTFTVTPSAKRGFVRVDPRNSRYLAFDDGTPYFPIGENMAWYGSGGMVDYQVWLDVLSAAGGNFIRVWMPAWGFGIEWNDTGLGNYDTRQDEAFRLDALLDMADARGVYIMLTLINHGQYNTSVNPEWAANPFNAANGGPLAEPVDFATDPAAQKLWHQRLRYIAARWGYSTNIMAWEWWNEVNWTPLASAAVLAPWMETSTAYLETVDPYDHLITHSGSLSAANTVWDQTDFVQEHRYDPGDMTMDFAAVTARWLEEYPDKPFLMGEFGSPSEYDVNGTLIHIGLWVGPMNGGAGTGMTWWWDTYMHPNDQYYHLAAVAAYFADEDMGAHDYRPTEATVDRKTKARIYGLQTDDRALLWITNRRFTESQVITQYTKNLRDNVENPLDIAYPEVDGVVLTLAGLTDGEYTVEWWSTFTGEVVQIDTITVIDGTAAIGVPTFSTDWAVKIKPVTP